MSLTGLADLNQVHADIRAKRAQKPELSFTAAAFEVLNVTLEVEQEALDRIPNDGPVVFVANHPLGGLDGVALIELLLRARPDSRVFANFLLKRIPELHDRCFFVDPFGSTQSSHRNSAPLKAAMRWLAEGHALGAFPAGIVAHQADGEGGLSDAAWNPVIARLIQRSGATVVPIYFAARNSTTFQIAGKLHPRLRTLMLPRELLRRRNSTLRAVVGHPIRPQRLARISDALELNTFIRARTFVLRACLPAGSESEQTSQKQQQLATPRPTDRLIQERQSLPADSLLLTHGSIEVRCATADQIPHTLAEISRLRELTFREVGEGTGKAVDRDQFDDIYDHLYLWDREQNALLGAYRITRTDQVLDKHGCDGLYTSTLFRYSDPMLHQLRGALELGRSFVVPEAQRSFTPLMLLWKGIARYVMRYPDYSGLFGAVSISDSYDAHTRQLLTHFLQVNHFHAAWAPNVQARRPFNMPRLRPDQAKELSTVARDLDDVEAILSDIESSGQGIPILVRQYLRLDARVLGFHVDPHFGETLVALMYIDLPKTNPRILSRFFGAENASNYCDHHAAVSPNALRNVS